MNEEEKLRIIEKTMPNYEVNALRRNIVRVEETIQLLLNLIDQTIRNKTLSDVRKNELIRAYRKDLKMHQKERKELKQFLKVALKREQERKRG